jgi:hypothetical protein
MPVVQERYTVGQHLEHWLSLGLILKAVRRSGRFPQTPSHPPPIVLTGERFLRLSDPVWEGAVFERPGAPPPELWHFDPRSVALFHKHGNRGRAFLWSELVWRLHIG